MIQLILEFTVRAALIAGATGAVLWVAKIRTAAARHRVWTGFLFVMLLLPLWLSRGPKVSLRVLPNVAKQAAALALDPRMFVGSASAQQANPAVSATHPAPRGPLLLLALYLLGVFPLLARLAVGTVRARRLTRSAIHRNGRLTSSACASPVTVGWLHPVVILPEHWDRWPGAHIDAVWTHELEHARRRDPLVQWLALFNRAVFWFHPLAWWLEGKLSALAEEACDAAVLESGHDPLEYSKCLLEMARSVMRTGMRIDVAGMAMPGSFLPQRIGRILAGARAPRISRARMACAAAACAAFSATLAVATLTYASVRQPALSQSATVPEVKPVVAQVPPASVAPAREPVLLAQSQNSPSQPAPKEVPVHPTYLLKTGDQIIFRVPEAEAIDGRPFRIDADGNIKMPLLGSVHAAGMTPQELGADVVERLRQQVADPHVTARVVQFSGPPPVFLVGAFTRPGAYPLEGPKTLLEVMMAAGGPLPDAGRYIVITRRTDSGGDTEIRVDRLRKIRDAEDIVLEPLDVVSLDRAK